MRKRLPILGMLAAVVLAACGDEPAGPDPEPTAEGVDFGLRSDVAGAHSAEGEPAVGSAVLGDEFAAAVRDSIGGLVVLSYDADTRGLFILQVAAQAPGTYACGPVESALPCHARYFENVRVDGDRIEVDGRFDLTGGTLTLEAVADETVDGAFAGTLERTAGEGITTVEIESGTFRVRLVPGELADGGLDCLIGLTGSGPVCWS